MKMSVASNSIVGPVEGTYCLLTARTLAYKEDHSTEFIYFNYVNYPGKGYVWLSQARNRINNAEYVMVKPTLSQDHQQTVLHTRVTMEAFTLKSFTETVITPVGYLTSDLEIVDTKTPMWLQTGDHAAPIGAFAGRWYTMPAGESIFTAALNPNSDAIPGCSHFRGYDLNKDLVSRNIEFTLVPYTTTISEWTSDGTNTACVTGDASKAAVYFDSWVDRSSTHKQYNCHVPHLGTNSTKCLFINNFKGTTGGCNGGRGATYTTTCGVGYGVCPTGVCTQDVHGTQGFHCHGKVASEVKDDNTKHNSKRTVVWFYGLVMLVILVIAIYGYHTWQPKHTAPGKLI